MTTSEGIGDGDHICCSEPFIGIHIQVQMRDDVAIARHSGLERGRSRIRPESAFDGYQVTDNTL